MPPNALPLTRLRICLDPAEYARKRRPHFIRYIDYDFRFQHRRVEAFAYVRDCVLEVAFRTDSAGETLPSQMPLVCFNPDDDGQDEDDSPFRRAYRQRCEGIAEIRDGLDARFPECEQEGVGYLDDDGRIFVVMRLLPDFSVVIVSGAPRPDILRWNYPAQPDPSDANSVQFADSADAAAYADRVFPGQRQVARCMAEEVCFGWMWLVHFSAQLTLACGRCSRPATCSGPACIICSARSRMSGSRIIAVMGIMYVFVSIYLVLAAEVCGILCIAENSP